MLGLSRSPLLDMVFAYCTPLCTHSGTAGFAFGCSSRSRWSVSSVLVFKHCQFQGPITSTCENNDQTDDFSINPASLPNKNRPNLPLWSSPLRSKGRIELQGAAQKDPALQLLVLRQAHRGLPQKPKKIESYRDPGRLHAWKGGFFLRLWFSRDAKHFVQCTKWHGIIWNDSKTA